MASPCPDSETLAALIDGRLSGEAAERVEAHVADCEVCLSVFSGAAACADDQPGGLMTPAEGDDAPRRWLWVVAAGVVAATMLGTIWVIRPDVSDVPPAPPRSLMAALVETVGSRRVVEPRLSAEFEYARVPPSTRGAGGLDPRDPESRDAIDIAERLVTENRGTDEPASVSDAAQALLLLGRVDDAVSLLEEALPLHPGRPRLNADLGAALYLRGTSSGIDDLRGSVRASQSAIVVQPALAAAHFNKALALDRLCSLEPPETSRCAQAVDAWRTFLAVESGTGWSSEAIERLNALESR